MKLGTPKLLIEILLLSSILVLSLLGQFARIETFIGSVNMHEIGILLFMIFTIKSADILVVKKYLKNPQSLALITLILWSTSITVLRAWPQLSHALQGIAYIGRVALYLAFIWFISLWTRKNKKKEALITRGVTIWFGSMAILGIAQYLSLPDTRIFMELGWDDHLSRAFGTLFDPTFYGGITAMGSVWMFFHGFGEKKFSKQLPWIIGFSISLIATTLSFSRLAYLSYTVGFLALAFLLRQRRVLLTIPLLIMALLLVPKDGGGAGQDLLRTRSIEQRIEHAEYQTQDWSMNEIILGRGWNTNDTQTRRQSGLQDEYQIQTAPESIQSNHAQFVDSFYLQILLSSGVVGIVLLGSILWLFFSKKRSSFLAQALLIVVLTQSLGSPALLYPWMLLSLVAITTKNKH